MMMKLRRMVKAEATLKTPWVFYRVFRLLLEG